MTTPTAAAPDSGKWPQVEAAKLIWLSRYKSREGRAIARRAWEECERAIRAESNHLVRQARKDAFLEAASQIDCLFGVGTHPVNPYEAQKRYAEAIRNLAQQSTKE